MVPESEIQADFERRVDHRDLRASITGIDLVERAAAAHGSELFVPNFNLDYLARRQSIASARTVLAALSDVDLVSTASRNLAAVGPDRLFPDLVLKLLAYEQEVRNQLPFLSEDQIVFVLVSNTYPTLLSHAVGQAILWQKRHVLALEVVEVGGALEYRVVLPLGWTSTRLPNVPEDCF